MTDTATSIHAASSSVTRNRGAIESHLSALASQGEETRMRVAGLRTQAIATIDALEKERPQEAEDEAAALEEIMQVLADRLRSKWSDDRCIAQALFFVDGHLKQQPESLRYIADNIGQWIDSHIDDPKNFNFCLQVSPPPGVAIERVLNAGAQKQVFIATWPEVTPHKVAFKRFHDSDGSGSGDAFSHPLRGHHPNIIETFPIASTGDGDDVYLVERLLPTTLNYPWKFDGIGELVNLVRDIAHALSFVHSYNRIHGDIKLENIGFEGLYILLDFGLCRSEPTNSCAWTPTGNVRAMAPELLCGSANTSASDVWALGSVAFSALTGRPPYLRPEEKQHGFVGAERERALEKLSVRSIDPEWCRENDRRLMAAAPELELQHLLREMLRTDPQQRPTARQIFERCNEQLGRFLRPVQEVVQVGPQEELGSLMYLHECGDLTLASRNQRAAIADTAKRIDSEKLSPIENEQLSQLLAAASQEI